jgi:ribulose-phosphate 3-epimerase
MDNHYVPNLTFGPPLAAALKKSAPDDFLDVHLMTEPVDSLVVPFADAGADMISFHPEATRHIDRTVSLIRDCGAMAGLAFNPATPLSYLRYVIAKADLVLVMTVNPGFGGQAFIGAMEGKIAEARKMLDEAKSKARLQVDGGINPQTAKIAAAAGADTFVVGSALFHGGDYAKTIAEINAAIDKGRDTK